MKRKTSPSKLRQGCKPPNAVLSAFDDIEPAIVGLTPTGKIICANHSVCELFGYPREELEGLQVQAITPGMTAADWSSFWSGLNQEDSKPARTTLRLSDKKALSIEFRALFNHPSGVKYCLMTRPGKSQPATGTGGTFSSPLVQVLNSMTDHVAVLDDQHKVTFMNQALCRSLGISLAETLATTVYDYLPKRQSDIAWEHEQQALDSMRPSSRVGDGFLRAKYGATVTMLPFLDIAALVFLDTELR